MKASKNASEFDTSLLGISIYDGVSQRFLDFMLVVLMEAAGDTHIPNLYEIFGKESFLKFMDVFAGTTLRVPSTKAVEDAMRDVGIYLGLREVALGSRAGAVKNLARRYSMTVGAVRKNFITMENRLARYELGRTA